MDNYVTGKCMTMCPEEEIRIREKQKLLHILEIVPGTEKDKIPKADRTRMVKEFSRSAAGKSLQNPKLIRPPEVLLHTIHYLFTEVATNDAVPWNITYDYISDRLRSIRQDMIVQNATLVHTITLLQPIIRFYAYASFRLYGVDLNIFDNFLNNKHLLECLKRLLTVYDEYELTKDDEHVFNDYLIKNRPQFEALYVILNIGDQDAITRCLNLNQKWRTDIVEKALMLSLLYTRGNYVRYCRLIQDFPILLALQASLHVPKLRRWALRVMSTAYSSKILKYPCKKMMEILLYYTIEDVTDDVNSFGMTVCEGAINFNKSLFKDPYDGKTNMDYRLEIRLEQLEHKLMDIPISKILLFN
ncbi:germinal-center associated nuclear protein [Aethina tumida]|uniref:germinal-center associated nuclear protein n=1 Tax=Aethina tumida TaxID=116153 RepID=UPI002148DCB9|nr:germinal-center associated nuclear protein [Aethina tumida]